MAVKLSALRAGRPLPPRKIRGTHFCQRLSRRQGRGLCRTLIKNIGRKIVFKSRKNIIKFGALINKQVVPDNSKKSMALLQLFAVLHIRCSECPIWVMIQDLM
jgi:hypothetical protein